MNQIRWSESEFEMGSETFLKAAVSLPGRIIPVNNDVVTVGGRDYAIGSTMFQKLIKTGCVAFREGGYVVTDFGAKFAE